MRKVMVIVLLVLLSGCSDVYNSLPTHPQLQVYSYDCDGLEISLFVGNCFDPQGKLQSLEQLVNDNVYTCEQLKDEKKLDSVLRELCK